jgi:hypothetical protein
MLQFRLISSPVYVNVVGEYLNPSTTEDKISSFANLPRGWDYGAGGPIPERTRRIALAWNEFLQINGMLDTDAFAGGAGEIVIAAGLGDHYLEVIVEPDNSISVAYDFKGKQVFYRLKMPVLEASNAVLEVVGRIWNVFDYYTRINTIPNSASSLARRSGTLTEDYLLSSGIAFSQPEIPSQAIYVSTINVSQGSSATPRYSGNLTRMSFRQGIP